MFLMERVEAKLAELPSGATVRAAVVTVDGEGRVPIRWLISVLMMST